MALKAQKEQLERMFRTHACALKENKTAKVEQPSEAKSPCSTEVAKPNEPTTPTSPVTDSVKAWTIKIHNLAFS